MSADFKKYYGQGVRAMDIAKGLKNPGWISAMAYDATLGIAKAAQEHAAPEPEHGCFEQAHALKVGTDDHGSADAADRADDSAQDITPPGLRIGIRLWRARPTPPARPLGAAQPIIAANAKDMLVLPASECRGHRAIPRAMYNPS